jgi:hypothetical protein
MTPQVIDATIGGAQTAAVSSDRSPSMNHAITPSASLRLALRCDAAFSAATGLLQASAADALAALLGLPQPLLSWTGWFMLAYAASLVALARGATRPPVLMAIVVFGNVGWAIACIAVWAFGWVGPNALGVAYLVFQALAVFGLALWQFRGWRASSQVGLRGSASTLSAR